MAIKKVEIRPEGDGTYSDVVYPKTSDDMVEGLSTRIQSEVGGMNLADKPTLDTVNVNVGSNADVSSVNGSVHGKLKAVKTSLDNTYTVANNNYVSVGTNADSASATGSVHAKLKDIKANLGSDGGTDFSLSIAPVIESSIVGDILTVTGSGYFNFATVNKPASNVMYELFLYIDGALMVKAISLGGPTLSNYIGICAKDFTGFSDGVYYAPVNPSAFNSFGFSEAAKRNTRVAENFPYTFNTGNFDPTLVLLQNPIRFKHSFKILFYNRATFASNVFCKIGYTLD